MKTPERNTNKRKYQQEEQFGTPIASRIEVASGGEKEKNSPVSSFFDSLSPIKDVKPRLFDQSIDSFSSVSLFFKSPQIKTKESNITRNPLAELSKSEFLQVDSNSSCTEAANVIKLSDNLDCDKYYQKLACSSNPPLDRSLIPSSAQPEPIRCLPGSPNCDILQSKDVKQETTYTGSTSLMELIHDGSERISPLPPGMELRRSHINDQYRELQEHNLEFGSYEEGSQWYFDPSSLDVTMGNFENCMPSIQAYDFLGYLPTNVLSKPVINHTGEFKQKNEAGSTHHISSVYDDHLMVSRYKENMGARANDRNTFKNKVTLEQKHSALRRLLELGVDSRQAASSLSTSGPSGCEIFGITWQLNATAFTSNNRLFPSSVKQLTDLSCSNSLSPPNASLQKTMHESLSVTTNQEHDIQNIQAVQDCAHAPNVEKSDDPSQSSSKKKKRTENSEIGSSCKRCNCKKSKCLKLYCECFVVKEYCTDHCSCNGCLNKPEHEDTVLAARKKIESRNPLAFASKVIRRPELASVSRQEDIQTPAASAQHRRGCNCKKSRCLKKYCECNQAGVGCSSNCRCDGCRNKFGTKDGSLIPHASGTRHEVGIEKADKEGAEQKRH